jgi:TetR/AcrR family transcriptional regulator, tetracycline repressor protein
MAKTSRSREAAPGAGRLSEEAVVDAALALVADRGLEGLSMRALGEKVGVEAMSLYHWFPAKERLLDALADRLLAKVEMPTLPSAETWRDWLTAVARSYRRVALAHPRAFPALAMRRFLSPGAFAFLQANIAAHVAAGFSTREALRLTRSIGGFVNGIIMAEVAPSPFVQSGSLPPIGQVLDERQWSETLEALRRPALDGAFEFGLASLLDGALQQRPIPASRKRHR